MDADILEKLLKDFREALSQNKEYLEGLDAIEAQFGQAKDDYYQNKLSDDEFNSKLRDLYKTLSRLKLKWVNYLSEKALEKSLEDLKLVQSQNEEYLDKLAVIDVEFIKAKDDYDQNKLSETEFNNKLRDLAKQLSFLEPEQEAYVSEKTFEESLKDYRKAHPKNDDYLEGLNVIEAEFEEAKLRHKRGSLDADGFKSRLLELNKKLSFLEGKWETYALKASEGIDESIQQGEYWALERKLRYTHRCLIGGKKHAMSAPIITRTSFISFS